MMDTLHPGAALIALKPAYNQVIKQPSKHHIEKFADLICNMSPTTLQTLQDLLLFPLKLHLQDTQLRLEMKCYLVDCMREILQRTHVHDLKKLLELYTLLFFQIFDRENTSLVGDVPEELKLNVVKCVTSLLKQASSDSICELYHKKYAPKLGQGIYICIQLANQEKLRPLRIAAIECLMTLVQVHSEADRDDIVFRHQVGDIMMFFLPGLVNGLQKIITADEKQGHQITMLAIKAWGETIAIVMEDSNNSPDTLEPTDIQYSINPQIKSMGEDPLVNKWQDSTKESLLKNMQEKSRTSEWYHAAAEKLTFSARAVCVAKHHSHWKVRMELASTSQYLLSRCCRNLKPCVTYFTEILIMLSEDENENISETSRNGLKLYSEKYEMDSGKSLLEILEENFYNLVTKLPRIIHGTDDSQQLAALKLVAGYLKLLGIKKLPHVLSSAAHLHRLMWTLIQAFELESSSISLLEDYSLRDFETNCIVGETYRWKNFTHFTDNNILKKMENMCCLLGQFGDLNILSYHMLDLFHNAPNHRKEVTLLLNEIVCGGGQREDVNLESIIKSVMRAYLEPSVWYMSLSVDKYDDKIQEGTSITLGQAQSNIVLACLLVEGIGKMAKVLGSKFDQFLLQTLYVVLERAGSANGLVAEAGMIALQDLACTRGHGKDITNFIRANVDYISYHVTWRLHRVEQNPGVMDVLNIVMKYSTMEVLPYLEDIVKDVLLQSCDIFKDHNAIAFLRVFYIFLLFVQRSLVNKNSNETKPSEEYSADGRIQRIVIASQTVNDIIKYHCYKRQSEKFSSNDGINDESDTPDNEVGIENDDVSVEDDSELEKKKSLPLYVEMTVSVLKRCLHFLPTKKREQKLLVLSIIQEGLLILKPWENELLPIVHAVWSPFVNRFNEISDPLLVNRSFGLLCVLAQTAKEFIRSRTLKQVLSPLCQILTKSALESKKKDKGSSYRFTQLFKLQKELLSKIGDLAVNLNLQEQEIDQVLNAAAPYLSNFQPLPLQSSCVKLFQKLSTVHETTVWLKVITMWSPYQQLKPSIDGLHIIKVADRTFQNQEEFKKNIEEILYFLDLRC